MYRRSPLLIFFTIVVLFTIATLGTFSLALKTPALVFRLTSVLLHMEEVVALGYVYIDGLRQPFLLGLPFNSSKTTCLIYNLDYDSTAVSAIPLNDGILLLGRVYIPGRETDMLLMKIRGNGSPVWCMAYGGTGFDSAVDAINLGNSILVIGYSYSFSTLGDADLVLLKIDDQGNFVDCLVLGTRAYDDIAKAIYRLSDKSILIVGNTWSHNVSLSDILVVKLDKELNVQWSYSYGGASYESVCSAIEIEKSIFLVGVSKSFPMGGNDGFLLEIDFKGNPKYLRGFGGEGNDGFSKIYHSGDKLLVLGYTTLRGVYDTVFIEFNRYYEPKRAYLLAGERDKVALSVLSTERGVLSVIKISDITSSDILAVVNIPQNTSKTWARILSFEGEQDINLELLKIEHIEELLISSEWTFKSQDLQIRRIKPHKLSLSVLPRSVKVVVFDVNIPVGTLTRTRDWTRELLKVLKNNIPLLILAFILLVPAITLIIAWLRSKPKR